MNTLIDRVVESLPGRISLEDMGKVRLMNRTDTKFVTHISKIASLLEIASEEYLVQEIDGRLNMPYFTRYYDTPTCHMYYEHQRGKKNRQKIRTRLYEGSMELPFLEIKTKNNKGRTKKKRILMEEGEELFVYSEFMGEHSMYLIEDLLPKIDNHFYRITLVNKNLTERITIDSQIEFHNLETDTIKELDNLGIIEWKRTGRNNISGLERIIRDLRIGQSGFSKYCMGMAMTDERLSHNRLKPKIRMVERLIG